MNASCTVATHPNCGHCRQLKASVEASDLSGTCTFVDCSSDEHRGSDVCNVRGFPFTHLTTASGDDASFAGNRPDWGDKVSQVMHEEPDEPDEPEPVPMKHHFSAY